MRLGSEPLETIVKVAPVRLYGCKFGPYIISLELLAEVVDDPPLQKCPVDWQSHKVLWQLWIASAIFHLGGHQLQRPKQKGPLDYQVFWHSRLGCDLLQTHQGCKRTVCAIQLAQVFNDPLAGHATISQPLMDPEHPPQFRSVQRANSCTEPENKCRKERRLIHSGLAQSSPYPEPAPWALSKWGLQLHKGSSVNSFLQKNWFSWFRLLENSNINPSPFLHCAVAAS